MFVVLLEFHVCRGQIVPVRRNEVEVVLDRLHFRDRASKEALLVVGVVHQAKQLGVAGDHLRQLAAKTRSSWVPAFDPLGNEVLNVEALVRRRQVVRDGFFPRWRLGLFVVLRVFFFSLCFVLGVDAFGSSEEVDCSVCYYYVSNTPFGSIVGVLQAGCCWVQENCFTCKHLAF